MVLLDCREGLTTRAAAGSDEIQLRIDPLNADLDDEITGLRSQIRQLKGVIISLSPFSFRDIRWMELAVL